MELVAQVELLDSMLLSAVATEFPDPLKDPEKVAVSAYLVLCHASVEEYAEQVFLRHFDRLSELCQFPVVPPSAARLSLAVGITLPEKMRASYKSRTLKGALEAGRNNYVNSYVDTNDGLKERNIRRLAEGVGIEWGVVESGLVGQLADLFDEAS